MGQHISEQLVPLFGWAGVLQDKIPVTTSNIIGSTNDALRPARDICCCLLERILALADATEPRNQQSGRSFISEGWANRESGSLSVFAAVRARNWAGPRA